MAAEPEMYVSYPVRQVLDEIRGSVAGLHDVMATKASNERVDALTVRVTSLETNAVKQDALDSYRSKFRNAMGVAVLSGLGVLADIALRIAGR